MKLKAAIKSNAGFFLAISLLIVSIVGSDNSRNEFPKVDRNMKLDLEDNVSKIAFCPNGKFFVAGDTRGRVRLYDRQTWRVKAVFQHPERSKLPMFTSDSSLFLGSTGELAIGGKRSVKTWFWDTETGKNVAVHEEADTLNPIATMTFLPDGKRMVWGNHGGQLRIVNIEDINDIKIVNEQLGEKTRNDITSLRVSPDGNLLAVGNRGNPVFSILDIETGEDLFQLDLFNSGMILMNMVAFSPDGKTVAATGLYGKLNDRKYTIRLYDTTTWKMTAELLGHDGTIGLDFTPDGKRLVAVNEDAIEVIDLETKKSLKKIGFQSDHYLHTSSLSPDGNTLAVGGFDEKFVRIYDISKWR